MHNQTSSVPSNTDPIQRFVRSLYVTQSSNQADEPVRESALKKQVGAGVGKDRTPQKRNPPSSSIIHAGPRALTASARRAPMDDSRRRQVD